jgi:hypothetical protein
MRFDRLSLILLVVLAAARLVPQSAPLMIVLAGLFLARVTVAMRQASGLQGRLAPVLHSSAQQVPLRLSDAA